MFLLGSSIFVAVSVVVLRKSGVLYPCSKGIALAVGLSLLAVACLAQNYTHSLIPEANDGIGISNQVAYWIIGEDGWSQAKFRESFERSVYFTFLLLAAYPLFIII
jgi:hypothetical protein